METHLRKLALNREATGSRLEFDLDFAQFAKELHTDPKLPLKLRVNIRFYHYIKTQFPGWQLDSVRNHPERF